MRFIKSKGFTLLEMVIIITIIASLVLMSSYLLLDVSNKAKINAVKANVAAAASSLSYKLTTDSFSPEELTEIVVEELNNPDGIDNSNDEHYSPFLKSADAFTLEDEARSGQVSIILEDDENIYVRGYGKSGFAKPPILTRVVSAINGQTDNE